MAAQAPNDGLGTQAPTFELPGVDGRTHGWASIKGEKGTVVAFICNHCPYVQAIIDRLIKDATDLKALGVSTVAICSNDAENYPQDGFEPMRAWAKEKGFPFPYLHDESQEVAKAYGAVCTPDLFGYDAEGILRYRGRLDASGRQPGPTDAKRELFEAMSAIAQGQPVPFEPVPSIGCSIKWKV